MIGPFYLQTVRRLGGCPVKLITYLGTENGLAASIQCFFRNNSKHINMLHHQEMNKLKVGGPNLQSKEQIGRRIFSKIWLPVTYSSQQILFK